MAKKIQKIKLKLQPDYNFSLIGIVSSENDYTIIWIINEVLKIELKKQPELEVIDKKNNVNKPFVRFLFSDESTATDYTLVSNKSEKGYLVKEQSQIDYFLKIETESDLITPSVLKKLKKSKAILAIFDIPPANLKSKYNLLF